MRFSPFRTLRRIIPTRYFLAPPPVGEEMHVVIDQGKTLILKLIASGPVNVTTGMRDVLFEMNGEMRAVQVVDRSAVTETFKAEKSNGEPGSIGCASLSILSSACAHDQADASMSIVATAPMSAVVVEIRVVPGQIVKAGDSLVALSAMKMTSSVSAPKAGKVVRIAATIDQAVRVGDLLVVLDLGDHDDDGVDIPSQV